MPKRELSTIQIAAHLAQDYIEGNIADDREYAEEAEGAGNIFENLQQNLIDRRYEVDHADEDDPEAQEKNQELSDILFVTSDNPRTEDPEAIIRDILTGIPEGSIPVRVDPDRTESIRAALNEAKAGDTVILAGKGHETYQILASGKIHYDEREIVRGILDGTV